jgi:hypothetical protein
VDRALDKFKLADVVPVLFKGPEQGQAKADYIDVCYVCYPYSDPAEHIAVPDCLVNRGLSHRETVKLGIFKVWKFLHLVIKACGVIYQLFKGYGRNIYFVRHKLMLF